MISLCYYHKLLFYDSFPPQSLCSRYIKITAQASKNLRKKEEKKHNLTTIVQSMDHNSLSKSVRLSVRFPTKAGGDTAFCGMHSVGSRRTAVTLLDWRWSVPGSKRPQVLPLLEQPSQTTSQQLVAESLFLNTK